MDPSILEKAESWLNSDIDSQSKEEIRSLLASKSNDLADAFYKDLEFGTGGLRGIMGIGSNRINKYTVGKATQGLANYLKQTVVNETIKVAVAYDSRNNSRYFAEITASVFSANGIEVYFFDELRPTPQLSFAVRHFGCQSGVVITASHNPKEYNGYKAYWNDGAQLVPPHDRGVISQVNNIKSIDAIQFDRDDSMIHTVGKELDKIYLDKIAKQSIAPEVIAKHNDLKIVFSSIHGTGITLVPEILSNLGFTQVNIVEEQAEPNGDFPTVVYPNPEEAEAMTLALAKAQEADADLVMATDPDADRIGIAVKNHKGQFQLLNGNQTGALLVNYILTRYQQKNLLVPEQYIVKTIVTSEMIKAIADGFGVDCYDTLTGFKYIAALIKSLEGRRKFIAGMEESYGYMIGDFVRDKDAVATCAMLAEMAADFKDKSVSIFDGLIELYQRVGYYKEALVSVTKKGQQGAQEIQKMMQDLRETPPATLAGSPMAKVIDYQSGHSNDITTNTTEQLDLPKSNVLQFISEDGSKVSARPSGTEPKIKFYIGVREPLESKADFNRISEVLDTKIDRIKSDVGF
ncbi:MAG: phospho-sugar mutase [Cyclobacteriaceae bacterium]